MSKLRLEDARRLFIDDPSDVGFLRMVFENARDQYGMDETEINLHIQPIGFLGIRGKIVTFNISSSYQSGEKVGNVIQRVYQRLYKSIDKHNIFVFMPDEPKPIPIKILMSESDIHKLRSKGGEPV